MRVLLKELFMFSFYCRFISFLYFRLRPLSVPPTTSPELRLFRVYDSAEPTIAGLYHYAPTLDHVAHALACCTIDNHPGDTLVIQPVARLFGSSVIPVNEPSVLLGMNPTYREAQRVLSQAQASSQEAPNGSH